MKIEEMISAVQQSLGVTVDGKPGPETWKAVYQRLVVKRNTPKTSVDVASVDARSEKVIATLLPELRPLARALVQKAASSKMQIKIISGFRTYADQDALYAQGRSKPGKIVTNARAGYSSHNFGIAFDIGVFEGAKYLADSPKYKAVGVLGADLGLEWGGNWKSIVDQPHFQLRPAWANTMSEKQMLVELRARVLSGKKSRGQKNQGVRLTPSIRFRSRCSQSAIISLMETTGWARKIRNPDPLFPNILEKTGT